MSTPKREKLLLSPALSSIRWRRGSGCGCAALCFWVPLLLLSVLPALGGLPDVTGEFDAPLLSAVSLVKTSESGHEDGRREQSEADTKVTKPRAESPREWLPEKEMRSNWAFEFGVGIIGNTTVGDYLGLAFDKLDGPGSGLTYNFTAAYQVYAFDWRIGNRRFQPVVEVPMMLTLVDEKAGDLFPDYNAGVVFRWRDFPWNRYVYTTFAMGGGLSYSSRIWAADRQRHPGDDDRSRLKFWLPIEFTLALPRYPEYQLMLFIDHQSGGWIFDRGGVDAWGFGCRFRF